MSPFKQFQKAAQGTSLEPVARQYEKMAKEADAQLKAKQAKEWQDRFGQQAEEPHDQ